MPEQPHGGVSAELACARFKAALGPCSHPNALPVDTFALGVVAYLCPDCSEQLPADWR